MAQYYISPTGNDSTGNGTSGNPWLTIGKADASVTSADTVNMAAGTYTWVARSMNSGATFVGPSTTGLPTAIVDAGGNIAGSSGYIWRLQLNSTFTNILFQNATCTTNGAGIFLVQNAGVVATFNYCVFKSIRLAGSTDNQSKGGLFQSNTSCSWSFTGCLIDKVANNGTATGVAIFSGYSTQTMTFTAASCTFTSTGANIDFCAGMQSGGSQTINLTCKNTILSSDTSNTYSRNVSGTSFVNSLTYCCGYNYTIPAGTGNLVSTDPLFVDLNNSNYNLRPTSPCIDAGSL